MTDPWKQPVPREAPDRERMANALLHLGRIIGTVMRLQAARGSLAASPDLEEIQAAAQRAAAWLGVTIGPEEVEEQS